MDLKKVALVLGIIGLLYGSVRYFKSMDKTAFVRTSGERVEMMFENLKSDDVGHEGAAAGMWYQGSPKPLNDRYLLDKFYDFLRKGGVWMGDVKTYEFVSSELFFGEDVVNRRVEVTCKVNGVDRVVIVRHRQPLEWGS